MKKSLLLIIALMTFGLHLDAQIEDRPEKNIIKTNPILTSLGWINVGYEHVLNDKASILFFGDIIATELSDDFFGIGMGMGYRYYFTHKRKAVPAGFYIQPQIRGLLGDGEYIGVFGFELGYQWAWSSGFVLDLGLGRGVYFSDGDASSGPVGTLSIGYAW
jgi:hypothetical protein